MRTNVELVVTPNTQSPIPYNSMLALSEVSASVKNYFINQRMLEEILYSLQQSMKTFFELSIEFMNLFNGNRLYWVWASSLLGTVFDLLPHLEKATQALDDLGLHTGRTSWVLYYIRLFFNLTLLLAYTLKSDEEKEWTQRLQEQWDKRKFSILNDLVWGPGNMVCFFWLTAKNGLGPYADLLTLMLLAFDIYMTAWDFSEQEADYLKQKKAIEEKIKNCNQSLQIKTLHRDERTLIEAELTRLRAELEQCNKDWESKKADLIRNILYASALFLSFTLIVLGPAAPVVAIVGTVLCFALTIMNNFTTVGNDLQQAFDAQNEIEKEIIDTDNARNKLSLDDPQRAVLTEKRKNLALDFNHQDDLITHKILHLAPVVIPQLLIPPLVFGALFLAPTGVGFAVLLSIIIVTGVLATAASFLLNRYAPVKEENPNTFFADANLETKLYTYTNGDIIPLHPTK